MSATVTGMEKTFKNAECTLQQNKRLTAAVRSVVAGPVLSIDQCLEGLKQIW